MVSGILCVVVCLVHPSCFSSSPPLTPSLSVKSKTQPVLHRSLDLCVDSSASGWISSYSICTNAYKHSQVLNNTALLNFSPTVSYNKHTKPVTHCFRPFLHIADCLRYGKILEGLYQSRLELETTGLGIILVSDLYISLTSLFCQILPICNCIHTRKLVIISFLFSLSNKLFTKSC